MSIGLLVQEKKRKIEDGTHGDPLGFLVGTILANFDLHGSYQVSSHLVFRFRRKKRKIDFQDSRHGSHLGFSIGTI